MIYRHPPGTLSRWGVVDVGLKCPHSCRFCYYSYLDGSDDQFAGMRHAKWLPREHVLGLVEALADSGFIGFDVTGGEPSLHPAIVEIVEAAVKRGLAARIITLGQWLGRPQRDGSRTLLDALLDAGVADFLFSVHAVDGAKFEAITGGRWDRLQAAMNRLDALGFDYCTNTTVFADNFRDLPAIAEELLRHRIYAANLIVMNAYYAWSRPGRADPVQGHYGELAPYVIEARDRLEAGGIAVNIRYAPLCTLRGGERNLVGITGVRHDPHEWMNRIDHTNPGPAAEMGRRLQLRDLVPHYPLEADAEHFARRAGKAFPEACRGCGAINVCDGLDRRYLAERGASELSPYAEWRGELLDRERLAYLPAFVCKTAGGDPARAAVAELFAAKSGGGVHVAAAEP